MSKSKPFGLSVFMAMKAAIIAALPATVLAQPDSRPSFSAGTVMERLQGAERYVFVAGIIEGLAMARYARDRQQPQGMQCIYDWFYKERGTAETIYAGFQRYPSYPPGTVVMVLAHQKCGE